MHIAHKHLPSPSMGEGSGGGGSRASSPHPHLPPPGGKGCLSPPVSLSGGGERFAGNTNERSSLVSHWEREKRLGSQRCRGQSGATGHWVVGQLGVHIGSIVDRLGRCLFCEHEISPLPRIDTIGIYLVYNWTVVNLRTADSFALFGACKAQGEVGRRSLRMCMPRYAQGTQARTATKPTSRTGDDP
jgi:hypothetical protein